jgi:hypothetical protein
MKTILRCKVSLVSVAYLLVAIALPVLAQIPPTTPAQAAQTGLGSGGPIAIVALNAEGADASVTGALEVANGQAIIAASGSITSGAHTTNVTLPHRGVLRVCAATTVKLAADSSIPADESPGLLIAMDHGAIETSFATGRNADVLLTPDFRILIGGPGSSELKVRLGRDGDTCIDNSGANAPYVVVTSSFESGLYRVQPGQHVMFQHGSLHEVVDQEREPCGCPPPPAKINGNEFPLAQSEGLAPTPAPAIAPAQPDAATPQTAPPLVAANATNVPEARPATTAINSTPQPVPPEQTKPPVSEKKKSGFFTRMGHFFRRVFGAEQ